ncbi:MAG TPA: ferredoxin [Thermohalobaculum sp.]|nr:ferredoxin [Thermohalobaculum sp.]
MKDRLDTLLAPHGLAAVGAFHPDAADGLPVSVATLVLVGAAHDAMWRVFRASPEFADGGADPLDRWSRRVLAGVAADLGAQAFFPFGGPPYQPFQRWAARGEGAFSSPVGMQVSSSRGLWVSYRGALGLGERLEVAAPGANPCAGCPAPCSTACPVDAFAGGSYDTVRCVAHIASPAGAECREGGCLARHACPPGAPATPPRGQCGFHMEAFLRARLAAAR